MSVNREPAISRPRHPAADLPERPATTTRPPSATTVPPQAPQAPLSSRAIAGDEGEERLTAQHNVRIRPTTLNRLKRAVDKLRYETGDRTISQASITDDAIDQYLRSRGC